MFYNESKSKKNFFLEGGGRGLGGRGARVSEFLLIRIQI